MPDDYKREDGTRHVWCHCGRDLGGYDPANFEPQTFTCPEHGAVRIATP